MNRTRIRKLTALMAAVLAVAAPLAAQALSPSPKVPAADGTVSPGGTRTPPPRRT